MIKNEILTSHSIDNKLITLFKNSDETNEIDNSITVESGTECIYNLENVINKKSCIVNGLIGKIDPIKFELFIKKFGPVDSVKSTTAGNEYNGNSYNSFLVTFKEEVGALAAMNSSNQHFNGSLLKFIPYRAGDMDSERQSRFVLLQNLPVVSELQLKIRFENEGIVAARLDTARKSVGYLLLSQKMTAQRILKNAKLDYMIGSERFVVKALDITCISRILDETSKRRIFRELEIAMCDTSDKAEIDRCKKLAWLTPLQSPVIDRKRKIAMPNSASMPAKRLHELDDTKRKLIAEPVPNLLESLLTGIQKETDENTKSNRQKKITKFQRSDTYKYWDSHCNTKNNSSEPDPTLRYSSETQFCRKMFEWENYITDWVSSHRIQSIQNASITPDNGDDPFDGENLDDDDPFNPSQRLPSPIESEPFADEIKPVGDETIPTLKEEKGQDYTRQESALNLLSTPSTTNSNQLMPSRKGKRRQQIAHSTTEAAPNNVSMASQPIHSESKGGLAGLLAGLDRSTIDQLKRKTVPLEDIQEDPKTSLIQNPPIELRQMLRHLRIDKSDLKTLLDIPLAIISAQNVIGLVELKNSSISHMNKQDAAKFVDLLKKYLTPPGKLNDVIND